MGAYRLCAQPRAERVVLARARRADSRPVERLSAVSQRGAPRAAHHQPRLRRPAADPRPGIRRRLARARSAVRLPAAASAAARTRACCRVGLACLRTFGQLWLLRNSILAADYDDRAHDSRIPLQRYWQRSRHRHVIDLIAGEGPVLDIGCGSSRIIGGLPAAASPSTCCSASCATRDASTGRSFAAPASRCPSPMRRSPACSARRSSSTFQRSRPILDELCRVLAPGGRLVLGTPDYANWQWVYIEKLYGLVPGRLQGRAHLALHQSRARADHGRARLTLRGRTVHPAGRADPSVSQTRRCRGAVAISHIWRARPATSAWECRRQRACRSRARSTPVASPSA